MKHSFISKQQKKLLRGRRIINPDTYSDTFKTNQVVFAIFQIIYTYSVNKPLKWPRCRSAKVVTVVYGLLNMEAFEEAQAGKIVLGGCEVTDDDPSWQCLDCKAKIFKKSLIKAHFDSR